MKPFASPAAWTLIVALALFTAGCEVLKEQQPKRIVTIHEIVTYPKGLKELEKQIPTFSGQQIWVNTNPYLHSRSIKAIEPVDREDDSGYCDLKLELDRHGALVWMQLSVGMAKKPLAFVIDGTYYRNIIIDEMTDEDRREVLVRGPFDRVTAEALKKYAKQNYRYYNQDEDPLASLDLFGSKKGED